MSNLRFQVAAGAGASAFADKGASANRFARLFDPTLALHYKFATTQSLKDLRGGPTLGVVRAAGTATRVNAQGLIESVAANIGRFDFDPATKESLGLRYEETRTNIALQSGDLVSAPWTSIQTPGLTENSAISPRGLLEVTLLTDNNATNREGAQQSITVATDSLFRTASIFVKKTTGATSPTFGTEMVYAGGTGTTPVQLRLNTDTGETNGDGGGSTQAEDFGDYWRIWARHQNNGTNTSLQVKVFPALAAHGSFVDVISTTGSAHAWGYQVELGTTPTSYIETAGGAVLRNGDLISTADVSWLNVLAGTMFTETRVAEILESGVGTPNILRLDDSSENNRIVFSYDREPGSYRSFVFMTALGGTAHNINETNLALVAGDTLRLAMAWGGTTFITSSNGLAVRTKTGITVPTGIDTLRFSSLAGTAQNNGHLREMRYYNVKKSEEFIKNLSAGLIPA